MKHYFITIGLITLLSINDVWCQSSLEDTSLKVGIGDPAPSTTLTNNGRLIIRGIDPVKDDDELYSLYVAKQDFSFTDNQGNIVSIKKGQVFKSRVEDIHPILTYELNLKTGREQLKDGTVIWTDWIEKYNTGIDANKYIAFITEATLMDISSYDVGGNGGNGPAFFSHIESWRDDETNPVKAVKLFVENGKYILNADYLEATPLNNDIRKNKSGFYWKIRIILMDRRNIKDLTNTTYQFTMDNLSNGSDANRVISNQIDAIGDDFERTNNNRNVVNGAVIPNVLSFDKIFKKPDFDYRTGINTTTPEATLDVNGRLAITEAPRVRRYTYDIIPLVTNEKGEIKSFSSYYRGSKPFSVIEGFINTRGGGNKIQFAAEMSTANYPVTIGDQDWVEDFDTKIPYDEYLVIPLQSFLNNYEYKRRSVQQNIDRYGMYGFPIQRRNKDFVKNNWFSSYTLKGMPIYPYEDDIKDIRIEGVSGKRGERSWSDQWSFYMGVGHNIDKDNNGRNAEKVQRMYRGASYKTIPDLQAGTRLGEREEKDTWHFRSDYYGAAPVFGMVMDMSGNNNDWFQPRYYKQHMNHFYWEYRWMAMSRALIEDLGVMYDDMMYYNYSGKSYNNMYPATLRRENGDDIVKFLRSVKRMSPEERKQKVPILPRSKNLNQGLIEEFIWNISPENNPK